MVSLQEALKKAGITVSADDEFASGTYKAVRKFQK